MIVRTFIECNTCFKSITLRVQLGHRDFEEFKFLCPFCNENLSIGLYLDQKNLKYEIKAMLNCKKTVNEGETGKEIYLSSEIITSNEIIKSDFPFPSIYLGHKLHTGKINKYLVIETSIKRWDFLKRAFDQKQQKNFELEEILLQNYRNENNLKKDAFFKNCLFHFCGTHFNDKKYKQIENVFKFIEIYYKTSKSEVINLRNYLRSQFNVNISFIMETIQEIYSNIELHIPIINFLLTELYNKDELYYSLNDFNKIKQTYGNIYEKLSELVVVFAGLFNISENRSFGTFKNMNLKTYESIDKANKLNPFKGISEFMIFCIEYDSYLRNSSHHGHIHFDKNYNEILYYTEKQENTKNMSLKDYLIKTNIIFINMLAVLSIWLFIIIIED